MFAGKYGINMDVTDLDSWMIETYDIPTVTVEHTKISTMLL